MNQVEHKRISEIVNNHFRSLLEVIPKRVSQEELAQKNPIYAKKLGFKARLDKLTKLKQEVEQIETSLMDEFNTRFPRIADEAADYDRHGNRPRLATAHDYMAALTVVMANQEQNLRERKEKIQRDWREALARLEIIEDRETLKQFFADIGILAQP